VLFNRYKESVNIEGITEQIKILLIAPSNEKSSIANKILVKKSKTL